VSFPSPGPHPLFPLGAILWWALVNSSCLPNLKSLASAVAEILKGATKFWGVSQAQGRAHFYSAWDFMMGLGKPQRLAKFEVAGFIYYGYIRKFVFKNSDKLKWGNPLFWGNWLYRWIRRPNVPIQCATVVKLRLEQMGDFYEKPHFTMGPLKSGPGLVW